MVQIPRENLRGLERLGVNISDRNQIVSLALRAAQDQQDGFDRFNDDARRRGFKGHKLQAELGGLEKWDFSGLTTPTEAGAEPGSQWDPNAELEAAQAAARAAQGGPGVGQGQTASADEQWQQYIRRITEPIIKKGIQQGISEYDGTVKKTQAEREREASEKATVDASFAAEDQAMEELFQEEGIAPDPKEVPWLGASRKADVRREMLWDGILGQAQRMREDTIAKDDPQRATKLKLGLPKHFIRSAFAVAKPFMSASDAKAVQAAVNQMAKLPGATLPAGAGGTPSPDIDKMTPAQREHAAVEKARSKGKLRQNYT